MSANIWRRGTLLGIALFVTSACSETAMQSAKCDSRLGVSASEGAAAFEHEVDHKAFNSTFLRPEIAKLYGIDQDKKLGVVMVSVYQKDSLGIGVEACVSGGAKNLLGQTKGLNFDEIREGQAIYHISTFRFSHEEHITFEVDVEIAATGETHELKWQQQF
ncbi:MAG: DUF4426 domain-containing protein, partial [Gammaproteobacteria bacterium]|nr:DUF4426 domain-containing protein [Gammaproteobacteria bacterium]